MPRMCLVASRIPFAILHTDSRKLEFLSPFTQAVLEAIRTPSMAQGLRGDNYICRLATIRSAASGQPAGLCQPVINGHGCAGSAHEADTYGWQDPGGRGGRQ